MKTKINLYIVCMVLGLGLISCGSTPKFNGKADLCGLVIDEKNKPVEGMTISCRSNGFEMGCTLTNESGLFVLENLNSGNYEIYGCKSGYEKLEKIPVKFYGRDNVCCFQVSSGDSLLDEIEQLFSKRKFEDGIQLLEKMGYEPKDSVNALVCFYKAYGFAMLERKKECLKELKVIEELKSAGFFDVESIRRILKKT